jgi:2-polyprenyl-6-methoxyphenol hydroxylase-like FAD-dependent oxidoreductase
VLISGAGIAGLSLALRLPQRGLTLVVVIDPAWVILSYAA